MRQTETEEVLPTKAGRSPERPVFIPGAQQFHGRAGDGLECLATLDGQSVVLSRAVAGLPCRIRLTPAQYRGIAAVPNAGRCIVRLIHSDPGLTVDLAESPDAETATGERDRLAALLAIPAIEQPTVHVAPEQGRRPLGHQLKRPRFLKRRRLGGSIAPLPVDGREIIAPD